MFRWIKWIAGLAALVLIAVWLLFSSSLLDGPRGNLVAGFLSKKLGQDLIIQNGARVELGSVLGVSAGGIALPGQGSDESDLIEIGQLKFDLPLDELLDGQIVPRNIEVSGARVTLLEDQNGAKSWSSEVTGQTNKPETGGEAKPAPGQREGIPPGLSELLGGEGIQFSDTSVSYKSAVNGLELDFTLAELNAMKSGPDKPLELKGNGDLNGEEMTLTGSLPPSGPFAVSLEFEHITLGIDGEPEAGGFRDGFSAELSANITKLGQLLDALKLEKSIEGTGQVGALLKVSNDTQTIEGVDLQVALDTGQSLSVTGDLGQLGDPTDVTLDTDIRLYPDDNRPPPTTARRELKLIAVRMQMFGQKGGTPSRRMVIETNGFKMDTSGEGPAPVSVSKISRTPEGFLKLGELELRIGPPPAPFVVLTGKVSDVLRLEGVEAKGIVAIPAASLLAPEYFQDSDALGKLTGGFDLEGNAQKLSLSGLQASTEGTDLWNLEVTGSVENALKFADVALNVSANVPSGAELLTTLDLEPVSTGPVKLTADLNSDSKEWAAAMTVSVDESQLGISALLDLDEPSPIVRGGIESDLIHVDHFREIVAAAVQLSRLDDLEKSASQGNAPTKDETDDEKVEEPLVVEPQKEEGTDNDGYEPLVLNPTNTVGTDNAENADQPGAGPFRNVTLQPLGKAILLSGMDMDVSIDLRKIEGDKGTTSLNSELVMKDRKAQLGPLKFEYGDAHFDVTGSMDLINDPDTLKIAGSTGGWNLGKIMRDLRFKKSVTGYLYASFDVTGKSASVRDYLKTMNGAATVSMRNGSIDTQLLDLAGLGVIPWLFSKERGKTAAITCLSAPLHLSNGRISTKHSTLETSQVQIVVVGNVDLGNKTIDVMGQPRRIGKPLARSPWPFTAVGPLSKPKIKVKDGPRRLQRSDGASTMPKRRKPCVPDILQLR